jgi:hypothetical protein
MKLHWSRVAYKFVVPWKTVIASIMKYNGKKKKVKNEVENPVGESK